MVAIDPLLSQVTMLNTNFEQIFIGDQLMHFPISKKQVSAV